MFIFTNPGRVVLDNPLASPMLSATTALDARSLSQLDQVGTSTPTPIHVGLVVFHALAAHHLAELVLVNKMVPVVLTDHVKIAHPFPASPRAVVLIDLWGLPLPLTEYIEGLSAAIPGCAFLALDSAKPEVDVARLLHSGIAGFITHAESSQLLGAAIQAVAAGRVWASPEIIRIYVELTSQRFTVSSGVEMLTVRENQVLELLRKRYSNREMAQLLRISESTVKFHVSNVLTKLKAHHRRDLVNTDLCGVSLLLETCRAGKSAAGLAHAEPQERNCRVSTFSGLAKVSQPGPFFNSI
jgi:two-component system, NarL family, response regulator LiaR